MKLKKIIVASLGLIAFGVLASCQGGNPTQGTSSQIPTPANSSTSQQTPTSSITPITPTSAPSSTSTTTEEEIPPVLVNLNKTYLLTGSDRCEGLFNIVVKDNLIDTISYISLEDYEINIPQTLKFFYDENSIFPSVYLVSTDSEGGLYTKISINNNVLNLGIEDFFAQLTQDGLLISSPINKVEIKIKSDFTFEISDNILDSNNYNNEYESLLIEENKITYLYTENEDNEVKYELIMNEIFYDLLNYNNNFIYKEQTLYESENNAIIYDELYHKETDPANKVTPSNRITYIQNEDNTTKSVLVYDYKSDYYGYALKEEVEYEYNTNKTISGYKNYDYFEGVKTKTLDGSLTYYDGTNLVKEVNVYYSYDGETNTIKREIEYNDYGLITYDKITNDSKHGTDVDEHIYEYTGMIKTKYIYKAEEFVSYNGNNVLVDGFIYENNYNLDGLETYYGTKRYNSLDKEYYKDIEYTLQYDENGRQILFENIAYGYNEIIDALKVVSTYNEIGDTLTEIYYYYDSVTKEYVKEAEYVNEYDDNGKHTVNYETRYYGQDDKDCYKTTYEYDESDNLISTKLYHLVGDEYNFLNEETYSIEDKEEYVVETTIYADGTSYIKYSYKNSPNYDLVEIEKYGNDSFIYNKSEYRYIDEKSYVMTTYEKDSPDSEYTPLEKTTYIYTKYGLTTYKEEIYENGEWVLDSESIKEYDELGNLTKKSSYNSMFFGFESSISLITYDEDNRVLSYIIKLGHLGSEEEEESRTWEYYKNDEDQDVITYTVIDYFDLICKTVNNIILGDNGAIENKIDTYEFRDSVYVLRETYLYKFNENLDIIYEEHLTYNESGILEKKSIETNENSIEKHINKIDIKEYIDGVIDSENIIISEEGINYSINSDTGFIYDNGEISNGEHQIARRTKNPNNDESIIEVTKFTYDPNIDGDDKFVKKAYVYSKIYKDSFEIEGIEESYSNNGEIEEGCKTIKEYEEMNEFVAMPDLLKITYFEYDSNSNEYVITKVIEYNYIYNDEGYRTSDSTKIVFDYKEEKKYTYNWDYDIEDWNDEPTSTENIVTN